MIEEVRADLKEMKADIKTLVVQSAIHNELLKTHEARSLELKSRQDLLSQRLSPIEKQSMLLSICLSALGTLLLAVLGKILLSALHLI